MRHVLENFIRRRFFVVNLVLLAVAAVLVARTVTAVAGHVVADKIKEKTGLDKPVVAHVPPPKPSSNRDFAQASDENIFLGKREVVATDQSTVKPPSNKPAAGTDCPDATKSSLRLRLVGTVVFSTPESSLASIVDEGKSGSLAEMYSVNDCVDVTVDPNDPNAKLAAKRAPCNQVGDSAQLVAIFPERACLWNDGHPEYIAIADAKIPAAPKPVAANNDPPPDSDINIKKTGENDYEVKQEEVNKALNNLAELSTQARVVPAFEGGKTVGFKLFSIRPGSLYSKIGLQNGDVVTAINGYEMTDPAKGLEIYTKLKDAKAVNVDMKRRGKAMTLNYNITP